MVFINKLNNLTAIKVGIFDSGVGGIPVYETLKSMFSKSEYKDSVYLKYLGDTKNYPYGTKTEEQLQKIVAGNVYSLLDEGCSVVGIACNTASIVYNRLVNQYIYPNVVPVIEISAQKAAEAAKKHVHVISSNFTANEHGYREILNKINKDLKVTESGEQDFIQSIETANTVEIQEHISQVVSNLPNTTDTLVLGCTHFSHIYGNFEKELLKSKRKVTLVDPTKELAQKLYEKVINIFGCVEKSTEETISFSGNTPNYLFLTERK